MDNHLYEIIGTYGLIAVFFLVMIEGDITLLLAGVLAHSGFHQTGLTSRVARGW